MRHSATLLNMRNNELVSILLLAKLCLLLVITFVDALRPEAMNGDDGTRNDIRVNRSPEPTVMVLGENISNPRIGATVTLHCVVDMPVQTDAIFVRWTFGKAILSDNENLIADMFRFNIIKTQETSATRTVFTLINSNVMSSDFGEYRCVVGYDAYNTGQPGMQMWAKIEITRVADVSYISQDPFPQCNTDGGVDGNSNVWFEGQHMYVECNINTGDPNIELVWYWITVPGLKKRLGMEPHRENGTSSVSFHITAHSHHDEDIFICESTNLQFPGMRRNCTIGPISIINQLPTSKPEVSKNSQGTSGSVTRSPSVLITLQPTVHNYTPVIVIGIILGMMILVLLVTTVFIIWLRKKRPNHFHLAKNAKRIATNSSSTSVELYSSPSSLGCSVAPTKQLENEINLDNLDNHNYDVIHELPQYKCIKAKQRVAVPYAITEIQDPFLKM
ncbi:uncharacterized protein [Amphiura filiformis]|uniref:uncharacterized protein n=1 Tax=Amphiura filiformis TaxID=82378 RepID=UPI003B20BDF0